MENDKTLVVMLCRSEHTLRVRDRFLELGVESIVPSFSRAVRLPRSRKVSVITKPLLPGLVFAAEESLQLPRTNVVQPFRPMLIQRSVVRILVHELSHMLEVASDLSTLKELNQVIIPNGREVIVTAGPFKGQLGVIMRSDLDYYTVHFTNSINDIKVSLAFVKLKPDT